MLPVPAVGTHGPHAGNNDSSQARTLPETVIPKEDYTANEPWGCGLFAYRDVMRRRGRSPSLDPRKDISSS